MNEQRERKQLTLKWTRSKKGMLQHGKTEEDEMIEAGQQVSDTMLAHFSVVTKTNGPLTKVMRLDPETKVVVKDGTECWMAEGEIKTVPIKSFQQIADGIRRLKNNQALVHGVSRYAMAYLMTKSQLSQAKAEKPVDAPPTIARSKEYLQYPDGPGVILFDHDKARKDSVAEKESALQPYRPAELVTLIADILPEIARAGHVSTPSTSSCIYDKDGKELRGDGSGSHAYFVAENGRDIPRFLEVLGKRLFLAGYGRVEISRSGSLLYRTLVDLSVGSPERLDFAAGAVCMDGLVQKLPPPIVHDGTRLDTSLLPDLTPDEELRYKATKQRLIELAKPSQVVINGKYIEQEAAKLSIGKKISVNEARHVVASRQDHVLADDDQLYFAHLAGKSVSVAEVLINPTDYEGKPLADPLEPEYEGGSRTKAKFFWNDGNPIIHSYAHGSSKYCFEQFQIVPEKDLSQDPALPWFDEALKNSSVSRFIDHEPPHLEWIFKGTLLARTTGMMVGPGAAGKSTLALLMLIAAATGRDILPGIFTPTRSGKVLGVFAEDDETIIHHRMHTIVEQLFEHDPEAGELLRQNMRIVTTTGQDVRFLNQSKVGLVESDFFKDAFISIQGIEDLHLIVLDPVSRYHGAEENDNGAGTFLVSLMERIAQKTGAAVIILHHVGKRAGSDVHGFDLDAAMQQDAARGASGLTNGVRWQCNLFGLPEKDVKKIIGVSPSKPGQYLALKVSKKNYGKPEPVFFLERGRGGMLRPCEPKGKENDPDLDQIIRRLVLDFVFKSEGQQQWTERLLVDGNYQAWKKENQGITRLAVKQTIAACILHRELYERDGKNGSGKSITYLSLYPKPDHKKDADLKPEIKLEPEMKPEGFKPEEPEGTVKNDLPVRNDTDSLEKFNPETLYRKNDALRFVSPRNCETVEPEIIPPLRGDKYPSGLDREDIPQVSEEDENAEYF